MNKKEKKAMDEAVPLDTQELMENMDDLDMENEVEEEYEQLPLTMEQLLGDLEKATALSEDYLNMAQRVQADFDNFRRRNNSVRADAFEDGAREFAKTLLPVVDNLERAIHAAEASPDKALLEGVQMVYKQMMEVFEKRGIQVICRNGERFDPNLENAVLQGTAEEGEPGTVCDVFQKGYHMNGNVIRHAMVKVVPE